MCNSIYVGTITYINICLMHENSKKMYSKMILLAVAVCLSEMTRSSTPIFAHT